MLEARAFVENFDQAKEVLESLNAEFKGEYAIHDIIFSPKDPNKTLAEEFLRLRIVPKNIWNEKEIVVAIKNTESKIVGKNANIPLKKEFDSEDEARKFIEGNLSERFEYAFEFSRIGWQYDLGGEQVDLEIIEGFNSIEVKSDTEAGLKRLVGLFNLKNVLPGTSVVALKELLQK